MQRYIDGIDQKLFDLNNQISEIEYKNDYQNQSLSCDELKSEILGIFQSGKLKEIIKNYSAEGKDPILNKKMQVLKNEMHLAAVENDSDYLLCNNDIEKLFRDFNYMEHYGILLHSEKHNDRETALNEIEKQCCCTQKASICLIRTLNQLSRQRGMHLIRA